MTFKETYTKYIIDELKLKEWLTNDMISEAEIDSYYGEHNWINSRNDDSYIEMIEDYIREDFLNDKLEEMEDSRLSNAAILGVQLIAEHIYSEIKNECWEKALKELGSAKEALEDTLELNKERRGW